MSLPELHSGESRSVIRPGRDCPPSRGFSLVGFQGSAFIVIQLIRASIGKIDLTERFFVLQSWHGKETWSPDETPRTAEKQNLSRAAHGRGVLTPKYGRKREDLCLGSGDSDTHCQTADQGSGERGLRSRPRRSGPLRQVIRLLRRQDAGRSPGKSRKAAKQGTATRSSHAHKDTISQVTFGPRRLTMKSAKKQRSTFEVRLVAPDLIPERLPLRQVNDVLSAIQDLASGRDPFELSHVPLEKGISLTQVRTGSAVYACVSRAPDEARTNLSRVGALLASANGDEIEEEGLIAALQPIQLLSDVARVINGQIEVVLTERRDTPLFVIGGDVFPRISGRLLLKGETMVVGRIERAGGATSMRCLLRVPGRRRILYCNVQNRKLVQRLGHHLYEDIAATGTATWIHRTWRIYRFTIRDFTQPQLGDPSQALEQLRNAGLKAWDNIDNPDTFIQELRS